MSDNPLTRTSCPLAFSCYEYIPIDAGVRREYLVATVFELGVLVAICQLIVSPIMSLRSQLRRY
jgi:hypothetical protein